MKPTAPRRGSAAGFTMIELLVAIGITLILMAIVGEILNQVRQSVGVGTANGEVITYAGALETRLRDDFRRFDPQGIFVVKWSDQGSSRRLVTTNFTLGAGVITAISPPDLVLGSNAQGLDTRTDTTAPGGAGLERSLHEVTITDTGIGSGTGARAVAYVDANGNITDIRVIRGGANYVAPVGRVHGKPIDQIGFFANGPWVTSRFGITSIVGTNTVTVADTGNRRTFQAHSARVWYGHLLASTNDPTLGPNLFDRDEGGTLLAPHQFRLGRHALLISPEIVYYNTAGTVRGSRSIWQADDITGGTRYRGIRDGLSDTAIETDLSKINRTITDLAEPAPTNSIAGALWGPAHLPAQRMGDTVFRLYGSPFIDVANASSVNPEMLLYNQSVVSANCSGFKVEVADENADFNNPPVRRPVSPAVIPPALVGTSLAVGDLSPGIVDPGENLDANNTVLELVGGGPGVTVPATLAYTISGGQLTAVSITAGGSGYTQRPRIVATTTYAAGYGLGTAANCQALPNLVRVSVTLHDHRGRIHDLFLREPAFNDGRTYSYVLEVPQP